MKTKSEYLQDLEITSFDSIKDLKKQYRYLIKIYNSDNGTKPSDVRIKEVHAAYDALNEGKYKEDIVVEPKITPEVIIERYNDSLFEFLGKAAVTISLKKNDNKVVKVDNVYINFNGRQLTKEKFVVVNGNNLLRFVK